jgi:hypothetical protein
LRQSGKWQAQIQKDGKKINLGMFLTEHEAHEAYVKASNEIHGPFGRP